MNNAVSGRMTRVMEAMAPAMRFLTSDLWTAASQPGTYNFAVGNPQEMPLPEYVAALQKSLPPQNKDWFAYKMSERSATETVANTLRIRTGLPFEPDDIAMTTGGFAAISAAVNALVDAGDEVIMIIPPWFFYEGIIVGAGGVPVRVRVDMTSFDLDLEAIAAAITPKTRAIIVNSPNNPTGKIYPPETLEGLSWLLKQASERNGRTIYLLSDEAYNRIVFDGRTYPSPCQFYPNTLVLYSYGKTLLAPGQRIGYVAIPPTMPDREAVGQAVLIAQLAAGYTYPNALLQHALPDLEKLSIDIEHLQYRRDWMAGALQEMGYDVHVPEGTFYLFPHAPIADDWQFVRMLAGHNVLCLPGAVVEMPGYFRISLTASDAMIEGGLPGFRAALEQARLSA